MDHRQRLRDVSPRLLRLHRLLLDRERHAYEAMHGAIPGGAMLRLVLHDDHFAWLRSLSTLIAQIDSAVDGDEPITQDHAQRAFGELHRLLKSGVSGDFQDRYRAALQESPDVVMAHADVSRVLPAPLRDEGSSSP